MGRDEIYPIVISGIPNGWWDDIVMPYLESKRKGGGPIASYQFDEKLGVASVVFQEIEG